MTRGSVGYKNNIVELEVDVDDTGTLAEDMFAYVLYDLVEAWICDRVSPA
jgi:hypothetical protein